MDNKALKYLVNKPLHHEHICRWLLLFQEFEFEILARSCKSNVGLNHLYCIETGEESVGLYYKLLGAHLFRVETMQTELIDITKCVHEGQSM